MLFTNLRLQHIIINALLSASKRQILTRNSLVFKGIAKVILFFELTSNYLSFLKNKFATGGKELI